MIEVLIKPKLQTLEMCAEISNVNLQETLYEYNIFIFIYFTNLEHWKNRAILTNSTTFF